AERKKKHLVITVPGDDSAQARSLGQTARLYIRPVTGSIDVATRDANRTATPEAPAAETPATDAPAPEAPADGTQTPQNRPFLAQDPTTPEATPAPETTTPAPTGDAPSDGTDEGDAAAAEIAAARALRQSTDQTVQQQALANLDCSVADPLRGNDDPTLPLVACSQDGLNIYLLGPSIIDGQEIADASSVFNSQQSRHEISLSFKTTGSNTWAEFTSANIGKQAAFTLDSKVVSAPTIQGATPAGSATSITGSFTAESAKELANTLKYGSLPLSFAASEAETVSATLGLASLQAALIAGAVGLVLVLLYCLVYYRMLGVLTALSLILSGVMVYAITQTCCNDASCVAVCPVNCIHPTPDEPDFGTTDMLYIDPRSCIDCGACADACPVDAIFPVDKLSESLKPYADVNARFY
ncbi:MAG: 4Fe-4S binding protein, partial [Rhodococcus sp. (in: high G+C Gram-positive bacteria)]